LFSPLERRAQGQLVIAIAVAVAAAAATGRSSWLHVDNQIDQFYYYFAQLSPSSQPKLGRPRASFAPFAQPTRHQQSPKNRYSTRARQDSILSLKPTFPASAYNNNNNNNNNSNCQLRPTFPLLFYSGLPFMALSLATGKVV